MDELNKCRLSINEIDHKLIDLIKERFLMSKHIALYKKEHNLPILNKAREEELIKENLNYLNNEELSSYYLKIFEEILTQSKLYQEDTIMRGDKDESL